MHVAYYALFMRDRTVTLLFMVNMKLGFGGLGV
jgi:hypothetical protein